MKMNKQFGLTNQLRGIFTINRVRNGETTVVRKENMVVDSGLAAILHPAMKVGEDGEKVLDVVEYARILKVSNDEEVVTPSTTDTPSS